jgi:hypothetical protein
MHFLRTLTSKHYRLSLALVLFALCIKALVPAGFMASTSTDRVLVVSICADASGGLRQMHMVIPAVDQDESQPKSVKQEGQCAFSVIAHAATGGADAFALALAFAFALVLGLAPDRRHPFKQVSYLRPPLRGPPLNA